ncbi:hypothetical protein GCM10010156_46470 [Planobispora rosea]|uniref:Uncharacterized protein n=1 Tax=Planobispora rosea TaxID=35762 RepID=A0A8J3S675_PLARO|nr:hypothetical protein GCM10010156_46470 [Planobispora rosea]GIH84238.1 hypothetical protein Pro02_26460 [Planobispora rosea]
MSNATPSPQPRKGLRERLIEAADRRVREKDADARVAVTVSGTPTPGGLRG